MHRKGEMSTTNGLIPARESDTVGARQSGAKRVGREVALRGFRKPTMRTIQMLLGMTWIVAGALQYQPFMFSTGFLAHVLSPASKGQPGWSGAPMTWALHAMSEHLVVYNAIFATIQILIGVGLLSRRTIKASLAVSFFWVVGVWWIGEGFGVIFTGTASPLTGAPGAVLLYGLIGALIWPARASRGDSSHRSDPEVNGQAPRWGVPLGRVIWVALWLLAAVLWLMPSNRSTSSFYNGLQGASYGWLAPVQHSAANASSGHGLGIAVGLAIVSTLIGLGVLLPATHRAALLAGAILSLGYWGFGQSFGQLTTGMATDLNSGPLFVLLALRLWIDQVDIGWVTAIRLRQPPAVAVA